MHPTRPTQPARPARSIRRRVLASLLLAAAGLACQTVYYRTLEQFGIEKRHILADRVEDARDDQMRAQEQIQTTYERFAEVANIEGGDLERTYRRLSSELERSESRAAALRKRIRAIEDVAADMFSEWEGEIEQITDSDMRSESRKNLATTKLRYSELISAMKRVEQSMDPVLTAFRDRVLFLKHNLNAQAITQLQGTAGEIRSDVDALLRDMNASIQEADRFLSSLPG